MSRPLVALVGRPNVGKSTLFNRLIGARRAIVEDVPGTTRDRIVAVAEWGGREFDVVDTGGLGSGDGEIESAVRNQVLLAIDQAQAIVFLVDGGHGLAPGDVEIADLLRRSKKPVLLAVNKTESESRRQGAAEFWELGLGEPMTISALHGHGTGDMLEALLVLLPPPEPEPLEDEAVRVAIVGRPNVGKSSLVNRLLGVERVLVSATPGTTRDPVDTRLEYAGRQVVLVDTAGIRRRGKVEPGIEKYSVLRATRALTRTDVAVLVLDASLGVAAQDAHIAGSIADSGVGAVIAVNKWDLVEKDTYTHDEVERELREHIKFLDYAPMVSISALTGQRVARVLDLAIEIDAVRRQRVPTASLNRLVADIQARHNPPSKGGRRLRIYYATQASVAPPVFVFFVNDPELVHFSYERFIDNQLRRQHPFMGSPVRLVFRARSGEAGDD
jgi:GTP-binding protein